MFTYDFILGVGIFAFVTSITPGPNNIMLTASGANFGITRTMPHAAGVVSGFAAVNLSVGLGLGVVFEQFPLLQHALRVFGSAYMLYLAYKILSFKRAEEGDASAKPFTLLQAAAFQFVNPKGVVMAISANAGFSMQGEMYWPSVLMITLIYAVVNAPAISFWAVGGHLIRGLLSRPTFLKIFNAVMAALTALCVVFIWI